MPTNKLKSGPNKTENLVVESVESDEVPEATLDIVNDPESSDAHGEGTCYLFEFSHTSCYVLSFNVLEKMNFKHIIYFCH